MTFNAKQKKLIHSHQCDAVEHKRLCPLDLAQALRQLSSDSSKCLLQVNILFNWCFCKCTWSQKKLSFCHKLFGKWKTSKVILHIYWHFNSVASLSAFGCFQYKCSGLAYYSFIMYAKKQLSTEVKFVHAVSPGGSVKFVASGVNFFIFTHFLRFFLLKLLKVGEINGVKFLAWKSGGVKFWTNSVSAHLLSSLSDTA